MGREIDEVLSWRWRATRNSSNVKGVRSHSLRCRAVHNHSDPLAAQHNVTDLWWALQLSQSTVHVGVRWGGATPPSAAGVVRGARGMPNCLAIAARYTFKRSALAEPTHKS